MSPSGGLIGLSATGTDSITVVGTQANGAIRVRMTHGEEVPDGESSGGYLARVVEVRAVTESTERGFEVRFAGSVQTEKEQTPGGLAALMWGFAQLDWDDLGEIVGEVEVRANGESMKPVSVGGGVWIFDEPSEDAVVIADVQLRFYKARQLVRFSLRGEVAQLALHDLVVTGMFTSPIEVAPLIMPSAVARRDGRFVIALPSEWAPSYDPPTVGRLYVRRYEAGKFAESVEPAEIEVPNLESWAVVRLDEVVEGFWRLSEGPYRFRVETEIDGIHEANVFDTPPIAAADIMEGLRQRLETLCQRLCLLDFARWRALHDDDEEDAKRHMWRGVAERARGIRASVDVENRSGEESELLHEIVLYGVYWDVGAVEHARANVFLGAHAEPAAALTVPPNSTRRLTFAPFTLATEPAIARQRLESLQGFEVRMNPSLAGNEGPAVQAIEVSIPDRAATPIMLLGEAMLVHGDLAQAGEDAERYEAAKDAVLDAEGLGDGSRETYAQAVGDAEAEYQELLDRYADLTARLEQYGKTGLGELELHMNTHVAEGRTINFGTPSASEGPAIVSATHYADTGWNKREFVLTNSTGRIFWASVSAWINPKVSFAVDPSLLLPANAAAPGADVARSRFLPGIETWIWEYGDRRFAQDVFSDPDLLSALKDLLTTRMDVSEALGHKLRMTGNFQHAKGQIHEELTARRALHARAFELANQEDNAGRNFVVITGDQVKGDNKQLSDGMILTREADGKLKIWTIAECKSGPKAVESLHTQVALDATRIRSETLNLRNLSPHQQAILGLDGPAHDIAPDLVTADFTDPRTFILSTPRGVRPRTQAEHPAGVALPPAEVDALNRALRGCSESPYDTERLEQLTRFMFQREGKTARPWNDKTLTFAGFIDVTKANLPASQPLPPQAELADRYLRGERFDPERGAWVQVYDADAPFHMTPEQVFQQWEQRKRKKKPTADEIEVARRKANDGMRLSEKGRFYSPYVMTDPKAYTFALNDPLLSDADFTLFSRRLQPQLADKTDAEILSGRPFLWWDGKNAEFRAPTQDEAAVLREVRSFNNRLDLAGLQERRAHTVNVVADAMTEIAQRHAAALEEMRRMRQEQLRVTVWQNAKTVYVDVRLVLETRDVDLPLPLTKSLLVRWYRNANSLWSADVPAWLQQ